MSLDHVRGLPAEQLDRTPDTPRLLFGQLVARPNHMGQLETVCSPLVDGEALDAFRHRVLGHYWGAAHPRHPGSNAAYIVQVTFGTLFGWFYRRPNGEPLFIGYYLREPLDARSLARILEAIERGPLPDFDLRVHDIVEPPEWQTHAAWPGVPISSELSDQLHSRLASGEPIDLCFTTATEGCPVDGARIVA